VESTKANLEMIDILLVDDREENLLTLGAVLEDPSYTLIQTSSGKEALRYLLDNEPALILLDVQMPEMDGFEIASLIKSSERTREIPIIFITAINVGTTFIQKGYEYGAVDYIQKPYDAVVLKSKVGTFAELARKTRRLVLAEKKLRESEIEDRKRLLLQLELKSLNRKQAYQKKFLDLVEGINHGIVWSASIDSLQVSFVSRSAERILGYQIQQWSENQNFLMNLVHPDDRETVQAAFHTLRTEKADINLEHRLIRRDGGEIWVNTWTRLALNEDGTEAEIRGLSVDITPLKKAEENLIQNKRRSDFLAEASLILSESLDSEAAFSKLGELALSKLADWFSIYTLNDEGHAKELLLCHTDPNKMQIVRHIENTDQLDRQSLRTRKPVLYADFSDEVIRSLTKNDEHFEILRSLKIKSAMAVPLIVRGDILGTMSFASERSENQYTAADLCMAEDLARRVGTALENANLYQKAKAAVRLRDEFLSIASHELKTPITPLKLQTDSLMYALTHQSVAELKPEKISKMVEISNRQLGRLSRLVDNLLDIARINSGKLRLNLKDFDLTELIQEVIERFSDQLKHSKCKIELNITLQQPVFWDRMRIEQVITNLLTNAMKYGAGKPICISASMTNGDVTISFRDHGIGIAKRDQNRIFLRFERAVSENHFGGLGLGLYIVSQILEAHGGKVFVESEINVGSTFHLKIPFKVKADTSTCFDSSA